MNEHWENTDHWHTVFNYCQLLCFQVCVPLCAFAHVHMFACLLECVSVHYSQCFFIPTSFLVINDTVLGFLQLFLSVRSKTYCTFLVALNISLAICMNNIVMNNIQDMYSIQNGCCIFKAAFVWEFFFRKTRNFSKQLKKIFSLWLSFDFYEILVKIDNKYNFMHFRALNNISKFLI